MIVADLRVRALCSAIVLCGSTCAIRCTASQWPPPREVADAVSPPPSMCRSNAAARDSKSLAGLDILAVHDAVTEMDHRPRQAHRPRRSGGSRCRPRLRRLPLGLAEHDVLARHQIPLSPWCCLGFLDRGDWRDVIELRVASRAGTAKTRRRRTLTAAKRPMSSS
jgi:hypothetical protein